MTKEWRKAIPEARDRLQSRVLVWVAGPLLTVPCLIFLIRLLVLAVGIAASRRYHAYPHEVWLAVMPWVVSLTFGVLVWALRAATPMAAFCGGMICLIITSGTHSVSRDPLDSGLAPLIVLFALTFLATKSGRQRKTAAGLAEPKRGRNAAQVVANLGMAGFVVVWAFLGTVDWTHPQSGIVYAISQSVLCALLLAALCEATADTVSSEIGQAFGGQPFLLTDFRRVAPGTDGAVSVLGTGAGAIAAAVVAAVGMLAMRMSFAQTAIAFTGGIAGLVFDSLLGATVERKGWLGNDLVNFFSTFFAVLVALALLAAF